MTVKYFQPMTGKSARELVADVYEQIKRDFGILAEPFTLHSPFPELLAGVWMACRETELVGNVRRELKEAVALTVSEINQCPYCVDAHTIMLQATGNSIGVATFRKKNGDRVDEKLSSIIKWASATRSPESAILCSPPFSSTEAPEIIGTAVFFHYVNRMVNVLLSDTTPLPSNRRWLKSALVSVAGLRFSRSVHRPKTPGESLKFLPEAELPADLIWAGTTPTVAEAFARFARIIDNAAAPVLSDQARDRVKKYIDSWDGKDPGLSEGWIQQAINDLDRQSREEGKLALLTALAPYRVGEEAVNAFHTYHPEPKELLSVLAWGSFTVARKIGTWLNVPFS